MADPDELGDEEAARRRDEVVKRMLATPPQKHETLKKRAEKRLRPSPR